MDGMHGHLHANRAKIIICLGSKLGCKSNRPCIVHDQIVHAGFQIPQLLLLQHVHTYAADLMLQ